MKKRIIWKMFLLEIVTLGIYRLYWLIKTRKEMMETNKSIKILPVWLLLTPIIVAIIGFAAFIGIAISDSSNNTNCTKTNNSFYSTDTSYHSTTNNCPASGKSLAALGVLYFSFFVAFFIYVIWIWSYSQGVGVITKEKLSFAISLLILIVVPDGIDILIVQDSFNKLSTAAAAS